MTYTREQVQEKTKKYFKGNDLATNVFFKYCLKDGEDYLELTPHDMHTRLAKEFHRIEQKYPNPLDYHTILGSLTHFRRICAQGSPSYGIGNPKPVSLSNCFVINSPEDSISSIMDAAKNMSNLAKRRGGIGLDISELRPDGASVNNAAQTSSGAWSFAGLFSSVGRKIGQDGRRMALMITIDCKHPDVEKFITMKSDHGLVTGANVSVRIRDDFMEAAINDEEYTLQFPVDAEEPEYTRTVKARDVWDLICEYATYHAEPGILLWDNIIKSLPSDYYPGKKTLSTNPCGEIPMDNDGCRLMTQNLKWYVKNPYSNKAYFDWEEFENDVKIIARLSDDLVELEIEKLDQIISSCDEEDEKVLYKALRDSTIAGRRTGSGTHGLADCLIRLQLPYDSDEALEMISKIYEKRKLISYRESVNLAKERGPFPIFDWEFEKECTFFDSFPEELLDEMEEHGRRNIALLTNAPVGSISILSQVDGSGIEPVFRFEFTRRRKLDHSEDVDPDFVDETGDRWIEFKVYSNLVKEWQEITGGDPDNLPEYFVTSDQIDWEKRVEVQAAISAHVDHSISSTINLPKGIEPDTVATIYEKAWRSGCKGVTVYVDGSRDGVLITDEEEEPLITYHDAPKRPETIDCDIHQVKVKGEDWTILVGMLDGRPYEVLGGKSSLIEIPEEYTTGTITKKRNKTVPNRYHLQVNGFKIKDVVSTFDNPDNAVVTRMVSMSLRHGVKPSFLVEQLSKDPDASFASFSKVLARVLKKYIEDGTKVASGKEGMCPDGEPHELVYQEGCAMCSRCGFAKCG